jgi:hypothetical protein
VHEPAGGIIDQGQERAARPTILEPPVLTAVDRNQLAGTLAAVARLVDGLGPRLAPGPDPGGHHPAAQGLAADLDLVPLGQLLGRERRAEVGVALAHQRQGGMAHSVRQAVVARPAAST